jgi:hypothetical protein
MKNVVFVFGLIIGFSVYGFSEVGYRDVMVVSYIRNGIGITNQFNSKARILLDPDNMDKITFVFTKKTNEQETLILEQSALGGRLWGKITINNIALTDTPMAQYSTDGDNINLKIAHSGKLAYEIMVKLIN